MPRSHERSAGPLAEFVAALRQLRRRAGQPTYRTMARHAFISASSLCRIETGRAVPSLTATLAYVRACGGDEDLWRNQHAALLAALRTGRSVTFFPWRGDLPAGLPRSSVWHNHARAGAAAYRFDRSGVESLASAMRRIRSESGLTLKQIAARTSEPDIAKHLGGNGLPVSTISDLCNPRHGRVPARRTLLGFLFAVGVSTEALLAWMRARDALAGEGATVLADHPDPAVDTIPVWEDHQTLRWPDGTRSVVASHVSNQAQIQSKVRKSIAERVARIQPGLPQLQYDNPLIQRFLKLQSDKNASADLRHSAAAFLDAILWVAETQSSEGPRQPSSVTIAGDVISSRARDGSAP